MKVEGRHKFLKNGIHHFKDQTWIKIGADGSFNIELSQADAEELASTVGFDVTRPAAKAKAEPKPVAKKEEIPKTAAAKKPFANKKKK